MNEVKLQESHPIDENLRQIQVNGVSTSLELATIDNGMRVRGDLEVTGDISGNIKDMVLEDVTVDSLTTNSIISADLTIVPTGEVIIDKNYTDTTAVADMKGLHVDIDRTGTVSTGSDVVTGIDLDVTHTGASGGTIISRGLDIDIVGDSGGGSSAYGIMIDISGVDTANSNGIYIDSIDGGTDFKSVSSADVTDYFTINTIANGATTLSTVDAVGAVAHLTLDIDGDITLDAGGNQVYFAGAGTTTVEFDLNGQTSAGASMKFMSILDDSDYFIIDTTTLGATTITTVDDGGEGADLIFNIDGHIDLNSASGENITLDAAGDIILDADGGNITLQDGTGVYTPTAASDAVPLSHMPYVLYSQFQDDLVALKHYLPLKGYFEQTFVGNEPAGAIAPFALKLQKIVMRCSEDVSGATARVGMFVINSGTTHSHHHTSGFNWIDVTGGAADTNAIFDFTGTVGLAGSSSGGSNAVTAGQWMDFAIDFQADPGITTNAEFWFTMFFIADLSSTI